MQKIIKTNPRKLQRIDNAKVMVPGKWSLNNLLITFKMTELSGTVFHLVSSDQLQMIAKQAVTEYIRLTEDGKKQVEKEPELLTEPEVRKMLNVAHSTLWSYGKTGYLPIIKIGGKNRWRKPDVLKIMGGA